MFPPKRKCILSGENTFVRHVENNVVEQDKMEETGNNSRSSRLSFISNREVDYMEQKIIALEGERS